MRSFLAAVSAVCLFGAISSADAQSANAAGAPAAVSLSPAEAVRKIEGGALLVDVRSPEEFATGHLAGATNVPHTTVSEELATFGSDKDREIVLYCRSGRRAGLATAELQALGFTRVHNAGGYADLAAAGR